MGYMNLFDLVDMHLIYKWYKELKNADECGYKQQAEKDKQAIKAKLSKEDEMLVESIDNNLSGYYEEIISEICKRLFVFTFKAGMDMQKELKEED